MFKKIVINGAYGGFVLPTEYAIAHGISVYAEDTDIRTDADLIAIVEADTYNGDLIVVTLPDGYTDFEISEYDGLEDIIVVVNGKIVHPCNED